MALNLNTDLALVNTNANSGSITLPDSSVSQGRVITFKDSVAKFGVNALTLNTSGSDTFEDGTTSEVLRESNGIIQLVASGTKWYILTGTIQNTLNVSTLQALNVSSISISTANLLVSSMNNTIFQQSSLVYYNSNVFAGSRVYPQTNLNRYIPSSLIFSPTIIPNLSIWFDASVSTSMNISTNSTIMLWNSLSSASNVLTVSTPINLLSNTGLYAPNILNGLGGVSLSTTTLLTNNLGSAAVGNIFASYTITNSEFVSFYVLNQQVTTAAPCFVAAQLAGNNRVEYQAAQFSYIGQSGDPLDVQNLIGFTLSLNQPSIYVATRTGPTLSVRINGNNSASSNYKPFLLFSGAFNYYIGTNSYTNFFRGNIHEIVHYRSALPLQDIIRVEGYLAWKWNLMSRLPSSHPFRYTPPY